MQGFKIAILPKVKSCQNGTFEPLHEIQKKKKKKIGQISFESLFNKNFWKMSQGLSNPWSAKVQKEDFLKKSLVKLKKKMFWHGMNPLKAWNVELEAGIFLTI